MRNEKINTRAWRKYTGQYREVMRQSEYFRAALEYHVNQAGRGVRKELSERVGYKYQSMVSNILTGIRTADYRQCIRIALFFGMDLISFLELGRDLVERERTPTKRRRMDRKLPRGRRKAD